MREYTKDDLLVLAKRYNNAKRSYLLVDPLQAKHLAVSPASALEMMYALGDKLKEKYPTARLVIGFAETATAIAAAAASRIDGCYYIHTTREPMADIAEDRWLYFSEEHSHAVEQKICKLKLAEYASCTDTIILLDDEISTGKTLINIVERLRTISEIQGKRIVAASVINRVSEENMARLSEAGIECECLLKLPEEDYTSAVEWFGVSGAERVSAVSCCVAHSCEIKDKIPEPRVGVALSQYRDSLYVEMTGAAFEIEDRLSDGSKVLVLGTEECMYPAIMLGRVLEAGRVCGNVRCHATTRSPIGICDADDYPIYEGYKIRSFYDNNRETYIYNPDKYDAVVVVTDGSNMSALDDIAAVFMKRGEPDIFVVEVR